MPTRDDAEFTVPLGTTKGHSHPRISISPADPTQALPLSIISNSRLLREGVAALLDMYLPLQLIGSYPGDADSMAGLPNPPGHVVLLDGGLGLDAAVAWTHRWRCVTPPAHVLVFELSNNFDLILACVEAGAGGYTLQGASIGDVAAAIQAVRQGHAHCSPEVTARLFDRLASYAAVPSKLVSPPVPLTAREMEVLRLIAADYSNQQIADRLVIDVRTVKHHVHNILEKLKLHRRTDAAHLATSQGWLDAPRDHTPSAPGSPPY